MKNKSVPVTGYADIIKGSPAQEPVREMDISVRPCPVVLQLSGRGEPGSMNVNNYYIDQGRMGYRVLDGCLCDAGTFGSLLRGGGYGAEGRVISNGIKYGLVIKYACVSKTTS